MIGCMGREEGARKVVTKYATDSRKAVAVFCRLIGKKYSPNDFEETFEETFEELRKIFQKEPFRLPTEDVIEEYKIFIDPNGPTFSVGAIGPPPFAEKLKTQCADNELYQEIYELWMDHQEDKWRLKNCEAERKKYRNLVEGAMKVYDENKGGRCRYALVVQHLGLSSGKRPVKFDKQAVWVYYMEKVRHDGLSRREAVKKTRVKFGFNSHNNVVRSLRDYKNILLNSAKEEPELSAIIKERLKRFIPPRSKSKSK
jgi:hypothetical protein